MNAFLQHFHFLRPEWLFALIPLGLLLVLLIVLLGRQSGWQQVIPAHLYKHMVSKSSLKQTRPPYWLLALGWFIGVVALAGPTWERLPQPVFQLKRGHVVLIDMSLSMRATDVSPDRLTRAKYKAIDLVKSLGEGETGLVAYAGDAFVISPLTQDVSNITALLPALRPEIMPVAGSDPLLGFQTAAELLTNAGYQRGDIYWITDGIDMSQVDELRDYIAGQPFTVNVLGVGTKDGAPIRQLDGELLKDASGSIVIPRMRDEQLATISDAGNGAFITIKADDTDINQLTALTPNQREAESETPGAPQGDAWQEAGPFLVLLLLPLAAYGFRRGLIVAFMCLSILPLVPTPVMAQQSSPPTPSSDYQPPTWWQKPFMNADQEARQAYDQQAYTDAAAQFTDPAWQGAAHYRAGNYEAALDAYRQLDDVDALYNQGNALAKLGRLDDAIARYEQVLNQAPDHEAAAANKALLEKLKEQQKNQDNQGQNGNNQDQQQSGDAGEQSNDPQQGNNNNQAQNDDQPTGGQEQNQPSQEGPPAPSEGESTSPQDKQSQNNDTEQQSEDKPGASDEQASQETDQTEAQSTQASPEASDEQDADATSAAAQLTDEELEEQQRLDNLMRRVPDDPAFLLQRKMQLEAQRRQRQRLPANRRDW